METLPDEIVLVVRSLLDLSTCSQLNSVNKYFASFAKAKRLYNKHILDQALIDSNYQLYLSYNAPVLPQHYIAAVKGNLYEAVVYFLKIKVPQPEELPFACVKYDRSKIYSIVKKGCEKKCVVYDREWLPRILKCRYSYSDPDTFKYAVKYGNINLVKICLASIEVSEEHLCTAKSRGHTEILNLLCSHAKMTPDVVSDIDDYDIYCKFGHNIDLVECDVEILAGIAVSQGIELTGRYYKEDIFVKLVDYFDVSYKGYKATCLSDALVFYYLVQGSKSYASVHSQGKVKLTMDNIDETYKNHPRLFIDEDVRYILTEVLGNVFVQWSIPKGIRPSILLLFDCAIRRGDKELLEYCLKIRYFNAHNFMFAIENPNSKGYVRYYENGKCISKKTYRGNYSRELADMLYKKEYIEEVRKECNSDTILYLQGKGMLQ